MLQESCSLSSLREEAVYLASIIKCNRSQHRRARYYQKLTAVHRAVRFVLQLDAASLLRHLSALVRARSSKKSMGAELPWLPVCMLLPHRARISAALLMRSAHIDSLFSVVECSMLHNGNAAQTVHC